MDVWLGVPTEAPLSFSISVVNGALRQMTQTKEPESFTTSRKKCRKKEGNSKGRQGGWEWKEQIFLQKVPKFLTKEELVCTS